MLNYLQIRDFAIVDALDLELGAGMTVLTGETGAGKSILIDALGLVLGDRADSSVVREGCERTEILAGFDLAQAPAARAWLHEQMLDSGNDCMLRRVLGQDGRSKGFINGRPTTMQALRELGELLVDIHGQHEHQSLLKADLQRALLDAYAGHRDLAQRVADLARQWRRASEELGTLSSAAAERSARRELLRYQLDELQALGLAESELEALNEEHARLANGGRLLEAGQRALTAVYEDDGGSVLSGLTAAARELESLQGLDARLAPITELFDSAAVQIQEAASELRRYLDRLDLDPARLEWVEQRLDLIHQLARKHRVRPEELPAQQALLATELAGLEQTGQRLDGLAAELARTESDYFAAAAALTAARQAAAAALGEAVSAHMQRLGMPGGQFVVELEPRAEREVSASGQERVLFLVSANPGQTPRPLAKVASGGELSRISLAIQVVTVQIGTVPTLIFDEVDVGIGGGVAEIVGQQLRALGQARQVLTVTHLPQVASQGHHHLQVSKLSDGQAARTSVRALAPEERVAEVGRMLGGVEITKHTLRHAREMLANAGQPLPG